MEDVLQYIEASLHIVNTQGRIVSRRNLCDKWLVDVQWQPDRRTHALNLLKKQD